MFAELYLTVQTVSASDKVHNPTVHNLPTSTFELFSKFPGTFDITNLVARVQPDEMYTVDKFETVYPAVSI